MRFEYRRFRIAMLMFALGLAAVYMWTGLSISRSEVPVNLPTIKSNDEVLVVFPTGEPPDYMGHVNGDRTKKIVDGRDMSLYDNGGYAAECDFESGKERKECLLKRDAARKFVFYHFKQQRRGYVQVGLPCVDCGPTDHIFIEPDKGGRWVLTVTLETNGPLTTSRGVNARFRKPNNDDWWRDGSFSILSLIDQKGHEVTAF